MQGRAITQQAVTDLEQQDQMRLQRSVEAGLADARARVLPEANDSSASSSIRTEPQVAKASSNNSISSSTEAKDADADSSSSSSSSGSSSTASDIHAKNGATADDKVPYSAKNKDEASSSPERSKGSQLSDEEKQQQAVRSITGS